MKIPPATTWAPCLLVLMVSAILLACNPAVQELHNSDSIIHVLAASDHWTPFFWGQDRLGMLYSLPAIPLSSWFDKLIFTNCLQVLLLLLLIPLFSRWLFRRANAWLYGWLSVLISAIAISPHEVFLIAVEHPEYPGSLLPGVASLLLFRRQDSLRWISIPLMLLATWVNITVPIFLGGLIFLKHLTESRDWNWQSFAQKCALLIGSLLLVLIPTKMLMEPQMDTSIALAPVKTWIPGFLNLWKNGISSMPFLAAIIILSSIGNLILNRGRITSASLIVPLGAMGFSLFLAMLEHVGAPGHGEYRACYLVPVFIILMCSPGLFVGRLLERYNWIGKLSHKWAILVPLLILPRTGLPSKSKIQQSFDNKYGSTARAFIEHEVTHIGGISWFIFDHTFYTNHLISPDQASFHIKPLGFRDSAFTLKPGLQNPQKIRIGIPLAHDFNRDSISLSDPSGDIFKIQATPIDSLDNLDIYQLQPVEN